MPSEKPVLLGDPSPNGSLSVPYIAWEIQLTCNMGCQFCYSSSYNHYRTEGWRGNTPIEEIQNGLDFLARSNLGIEYINWSGGEPLLRHRELPAILKTAAELGFKNILSTNCMFSAIETLGDSKDRDLSNRHFDRYLSEKIGPNLAWLSVSWDSAEKEVNNNVMRLDTDQVMGSAYHYDDVIALLDLYRTGKFPFRLKVNTMVTRKNIGEGIISIGEHFRDMPVVWKLIQFNPRECPKDFRDAYWVENQDFIDLVATTRQRYGPSQTGFERLHISTRFYDGSNEPYCFLVINAHGEVLLPRGESHVVLANLPKKGDSINDANAFTESLNREVRANMISTRTYEQHSDGGRLSPLDVFNIRNHRIHEHSYPWIQ